MLAALQDVALTYLRRTAAQDIPFWRMASTSLAALQARAEAIGAVASVARPAPMSSMPGAGSAPGVTIPSFGLVVSGDHLETLRNRAMPIVARVRDGDTLLDLRSVDPEDDEHIADALRALG